MKNSRPSFFIDAACLHLMHTSLFNKKAGCFSFFAGIPSSKQFNKANTLQGNFEAAVFFVTEKHSRFFCAQNQKERTDAP